MTKGVALYGTAITARLLRHIRQKHNGYKNFVTARLLCSSTNYRKGFGRSYTRAQKLQAIYALPLIGEAMYVPEIRANEELE